MSGAPQTRAAELRAQMAREQREAASREREAQVRGAMESAVVAAVRTMEEQLDREIRKLDEVESMGDEELEGVRARRLAQMRRAKERAEQLRAAGHGEYTTITDQKEFFEQCKRCDRVVAHFARASTRRCEVLDAHLAKLARSHVETKFIRVDAERSPFLCERLLIHALPSVVLVRGGRTEHTMIGFEELGGADDFSTEELERVLARHGVVDAAAPPGRAGASAAAAGGVRQSGVKLTDDWED